jgi:hypothetical protein
MGTESLRFMMNDDDAPNFQHGGSTIPYNAADACQRALLIT